MKQPIIADNKPAKVTLEKGKEYAFCRCGKSKDQPFCDGSHKGSGFSPKVFTADKDEDAYLCQCKQTGDAPFCDGTHKKFSSEQVGQSAPEESGDDEKNAAPEPEATPEEPTVEFIHELAKGGLEQVGSHGPTEAMGVPRGQLPHWDQLQIMAA